MLNRELLIASVLKPVNETRMYEKIGISLRDKGKWNLHVAGYEATAIKDDHTKFYTIFRKQRLHPSRLLVSWKLFFIALKIRPAVLMVCSAELLPISLWIKIFTGCKVIYDVQENYYRNLIYTRSFPPVIKHFLALWIRGIENTSRIWVYRYLLAEECYRWEMTFHKKKSVVVANKYLVPKNITELATPKKSGEFRVIYSGTIGVHYGIFIALERAEELHTQNAYTTFFIVGYCAQKSVWEELQKRITGKNWITLIGGDHPVPHQKILAELRQADLGLMPYEISPATKDRIPTKLYEYMAAGLRYEITPNAAWELNENESIYWESEEMKLLNVCRLEVEI